MLGFDLLMASVFFLQISSESSPTDRVSLHYSDHCLVITRNNGLVNVCKLRKKPKVAAKENQEEEQDPGSLPKTGEA